MSNSAVTVPCTAEELRTLFNDAQLEAKVQTGELLVRLVEDRHPSRTLAKEPFCTKSQLVSYYAAADGAEVARVHRYQRQDGTLGASGKPDPKILYLHGCCYRFDFERDGAFVRRFGTPSTRGW